MRRSDYGGGSTTAGHGPISAPYSAPSKSMSSAVHAIAQDRDDQQGIQRAVPARLSLERRVRLASSYYPAARPPAQTAAPTGGSSTQATARNYDAV